MKSLLCLSLLLTLICNASAGVLWAGGEELDFPNGTAVCTSVNDFRSGYGRVSIYPCTTNTTMISNIFPGGAVTSAWLSARVYILTPSGTYKIMGLGKSGSNSSLWVGLSAAKLGLFKYDGTTLTLLAAESTSSIIGGSINKFDLEVINYGSSATVRVYTQGTATARITYSGDVTTLGNTSLNNVQLSDSGSYSARVSEVIVADSDSRTMSLATLAPNAAGTSGTGWTGAYTDINETGISDATNVSSANSGDIFQSRLSDLPAGNFSVLGVKISSRATKTLTGPGSLSVGVATNSSTYVPTGTALSTAWNAYEDYYFSNPVTSSSWTKTEINALEVLLQSGP